MSGHALNVVLSVLSNTPSTRGGLRDYVFTDDRFIGKDDIACIAEPESLDVIK